MQIFYKSWKEVMDWALMVKYTSIFSYKDLYQKKENR